MYMQRSGHETKSLDDLHVHIWLSANTCTIYVISRYIDMLTVWIIIQLWVSDECEGDESDVRESLDLWPVQVIEANTEHAQNGKTSQTMQALHLCIV